MWAIWITDVGVCSRRRDSGLKLALTDFNTFRPRVLELGVAGIPAVLEPIAAPNTATEFAAFLDRAALGARGTRCLWVVPTVSVR